MTARPSSPSDALLRVADNALKTLIGGLHATRPMPRAPGHRRGGDAPALEPAERDLAGRLMRVNHVGEVCAQALYQGQALGTRDPALRAHFLRAASDECDHLAWCARRLDELGARRSLLDPLWYAGALALGLAASRLAGDKASLGFVVETETQVEQHLASHLRRLPAADADSRAVVSQMQTDEVTHAQVAARLGGAELAPPVRWAMRAAAKVMTTTSHWL